MEKWKGRDSHHDPSVATKIPGPQAMEGEMLCSYISEQCHGFMPSARSIHRVGAIFHKALWVFPPI